MATLDSVSNLVKVTVSTGYTDTDSSIVLTTGNGAKLPTPPFNATWWNSTDYGDPSDDPNVEIIRVISVAGDTITILRAQETTTTASTKNTASKTYTIIAGLTALTISNIANALLDASAAIEELQTAVVALTQTLALAGFEIPDELTAYLG